MATASPSTRTDTRTCTTSPSLAARWRKRTRQAEILFYFIFSVLISDQMRRLMTLSGSDVNTDRGLFEELHAGKNRDRALNPASRPSVEIPRPHSYSAAYLVNVTVADAHANIKSENISDSGAEVRRQTRKSRKRLPWSLPLLQPAKKMSSAEFMAEINEMKRRMNITLPWEQATSSPQGETHLPTPIFNLNLPKSATLTLKEYFHCGGISSAHTFVPSSNIRLGKCFRDNFLTGAPPNLGCSARIDRNTTTELLFYSDFGIQGPSCFYPSVHDGGLDHIANHFPNSTIILVLRDPTAWFTSVMNWGEGRLLKFWRHSCGFKGHLGTRSEEDWIGFYEAHTLKIREFAKNHLHLTYVELELERLDTPSLLESYSGIPASCLQHCRPGKPKGNVDLRKYSKCRPLATSVKS